MAKTGTAVGGLCHAVGTTKSRIHDRHEHPGKVRPSRRADAWHWMGNQGLVRCSVVSRRASGEATSPRWKLAPLVPRIEPPYPLGLVLLRHRLVAELIEENRLALALVHEATARLPLVPPEGLESGSEQAETPQPASREVSSTASLTGRLSWSETA